MIRGPGAVAVAVRVPDGQVVTDSRRLGGAYTTPMRHIPLLRGVAQLGESVTLGFGAQSWSQQVASGEEAAPSHGRLGPRDWLLLVLTVSVAATVLFLAPVLLTYWLDGVLGSRWWSLIAEGVLRLLLLIGYVWLIGRSEDVQRLFQYHAAEHQTIHAYEEGRELTVPAIRRWPMAHPRCGTSFLLTVVAISAILFIFTAVDPLWWRLASRLLLIPLIAGLAYEVIRFGGRHAHWPGVRLLFTANIALQRLTTREPDDEQIRVAIEALRAVQQLEEEQNSPGLAG